MWTWESYFRSVTASSAIEVRLEDPNEELEELLVIWSLSARRLSTASSAIEVHLEEANEELFVISRLSAASSEHDELPVIWMWASCFISALRLSSASSAIGAKEHEVNGTRDFLGGDASVVNSFCKFFITAFDTVLMGFGALGGCIGRAFLSQRELPLILIVFSLLPLDGWDSSDNEEA